MRWLIVLAALSALGLWMLHVSVDYWSQGRRGPDLSAEQWHRVVERLTSRPAQGERVHSAGDSAASGPVTPDVAQPESPRPPQTYRPSLQPAQPTLDRQRAEYEAVRPKSVIELQPFRRTTAIAVSGTRGEAGTATLINLNPAINAWYVLELDWSPLSETRRYHLVSANPALQSLELDPAYVSGLVIMTAAGPKPCDLWSPASPLPLQVAATTASPYVSLCDEDVTLLLPTAGHKTRIEWVTDFLRDNVVGGEALTVLVRETFFQDAFVERAGSSSGVEHATPPRPAVLPAAARIDPAYAGRQLRSYDLGIALANQPPGALAVGEWFRAADAPGVFVSIMEPRTVASDVLAGYRDRVDSLDEIEGSALAYLVAFDLDRFDVGFAPGTDHPRVGWSERVPEGSRDDALLGPDGIGTIAPLVPTGLLGPSIAPRVAATFAGGFKRAHGAFRTGELASRNHGSHYGFVTQGVVLSKLQPGLSTLFVLDTGKVDLKTWSAEDDRLLPHVQFARQNGVSLIEWDPAAGAGVPGRLVARWSLGNWSGSQDGKLRTVRAGVCLQEQAGTRFLIYGFFSTATPSAMARVFQAYRCTSAMHLDMNALEHTYLALYRVRDGRFEVEHLIEGMNVLDRREGDTILPRFLGYADNRDFFYLLWRDEEDAGP